MKLLIRKWKISHNQSPEEALAHPASSAQCCDKTKFLMLLSDSMPSKGPCHSVMISDPSGLTVVFFPSMCRACRASIAPKNGESHGKKMNMMNMK